MESLLAGQLSGWDFIVAGFIVLFVEYPIKKWICKGNEKLLWLYKWAPVVIGAVGYVVLALIQGTPWLTGLTHGLGVGFVAMGEYDLILKTMKDKGKSSLTDMNNAVKEAIEGKK